MSVFLKESEQRVETAGLPWRVDPKVLGHLESESRMPREELRDGSLGRILIDSDADMFPASDEIASESANNAKAVAAFLLKTVCGWRPKQVASALGYEDADNCIRDVGQAVRRGMELVAKGVVRRT